MAALAADTMLHKGSVGQNRPAGGPLRPPARRSSTRVAAGPIPFGQQPAPAPPVFSQPAVEQVLAIQLPSVPQLPSLEAPALTAGLPTEFLDERATQPHWGSRVAEELLGAAQRQVPGLGATADALRELQAGLEDTARQLSSLPDAAVGGGLQAEALQRQLQEQLEAASAAVQQAASSLGAAAGPASLGGSFTDLSSSLSGLTSSISSSSAGGLSSGRLPGAPQLPDLAAGEWAGYSLQQLGAVAAGMAALVALSVPKGSSDDDESGSGGSGSGGQAASSSSGGGSSSSGGGGSADALPSRWDPEAVAAYYKRRPVLVARRVAEVAAEAAGWGAAYLSDLAAGTERQNAARRADAAMAAIERLGPAYVKVAQAMSTRVDLLSAEYLAAIQRLQDRVPPFPDALAFAQIERSFGGRPIGSVFSALSETAVAAASLGQVYRGTLRATGQDVAIKVRRPGVLESVSLDLHLMRGLALQLRRVPEVKSDWVGIIDAWAARFLEEMDYQLEAANTAQFKRDLASLPGVVIPEVVAEGTSSDCLVLSWIEGERLTDSSAADVRQLCDTLLNAYLIQLLDTGFLHADPHPGNLLRTTDGRIAILDHGLVTEIPEQYMVALLSYITHLSTRDWDALADDLVALGFVDNVDDKSQIVGPLGRILTQLTAGGGAKKVNIALVMSEIEALQAVYDFKVPPYFALILRTFSVIEGIALQSDPDYSIVKECFPFLARRLLTDDNPRCHAALRQLLFGDQDHISLERLERMAQGLSAFTVDGLQQQQQGGPPQGGPQQGQQPQAAPARPLIDSTTKEVLDAVFSTQPGGTYAQRLLVEELVSTADAAARQLAAALLGPALGNIEAAQAAMRSSGQLGAGARPAPGVALLSKLPALVELSPNDQQQLRTAAGLLGLVQQQAAGLRLQGGGSNGGPALEVQQAQQLARELAPLLPQLLPGIAATGQMFAEELGRRAYQRVAAVVGDDGAPVSDNYTPMDP